MRAVGQDKGLLQGESHERFKGRVALLTGAGSGIGRATTFRLAAEGAAVFAVDIDEQRLKETAKNTGGTVATYRADVSDAETCDAVVAACLARFGRIDVLGNIAGVCPVERVTDVTVESYRRTMGVNLDGYFFLSKAAIPHLLEAHGNIVNLASNAGLMGQAYTVVYCMTKGGVVQLTRALAMEYIKTPLRVNAIAPGGTNTAMTATKIIPSDADPDLIQRVVGLRPRIDPSDIAAAFAFIASHEGRAITGTIFSVDNGVTAG